MTQMKRIVLAERPVGEPEDKCFRLETLEVPTPGEGEVLVRVHYMSLDPYMRGRMDDAKSYAKPVEIGQTMEGTGVGEVIASNFKGLSEGDIVVGQFGWADHGLAKGHALSKVPQGVPMTLSLGALGMPGFTGWYGLTEIGQPKEGEVLVVAAATGPVGSMVGQIAKARGLKAIGIAGGPEKCALATDTFGFDACLDHRAFDDARSLRKALGDHCDGIDIYFENVGGKVLEAVLPMMNTFGRIPICGMIAGYNSGALGGQGADTGPDRFGPFWRSMLVKQMRAEGFIISNHWNRLPEFHSEVGPMVADGRVKFLEDVAEGLENAPEAFRGLLKGRNRGKQLVKLI